MAENINECGGGHVWSKVKTDVASVAIKKRVAIKKSVPPSLLTGGIKGDSVNAIILRCAYLSLTPTQSRLE